MNPNHAHWLPAFKPPMEFALIGIILLGFGWLPGQIAYSARWGKWRPFLPLVPQAFGDFVDSVGSQAPVVGDAIVE